MLEMGYKKLDNTELFKTLETNDIKSAQNYIPLYKNFFNLSIQNYNKINLNQEFHIETVDAEIQKNKYMCKTFIGF